jgi:hypothetical protein
MAKDASEPHRRTDYEKEQKVWLQLAEEIEQGPFTPKPKTSK